MDTSCVEMVIKGHVVSSNGQTKAIVNVLHYLIGVPAPIASFANFRTAFAANVWPAIGAALNATYIGDEVLIRPMDDATVAYEVLPTFGDGAIATDPLPTQSAVYLHKITGKRGRIYSGSIHFTPLSEADTTKDELTGAGLARWEAVRDALAASFIDADANTWTLAVLSRKPPAQYSVNPTNIVANAVRSVNLNLTVGTMRRRKEKTAIA